MIFFERNGPENLAFGAIFPYKGASLRPVRCGPLKPKRSTEFAQKAHETHQKESKEMKQDTHPDYHEITIAMTDGTEFVTRSTYGKAGDRIQLDIDPKTHPAWTGQHRTLNRGGQLAKFNKRFAGLGAKGGDTGEDKPAAAAPTAAAAKPEEKIKLTTKAAPAAKKTTKK